ncbi:SprT-like domain-containing protein [Leptothoe sp. EHU-05/26/07-4]
MTVTAATPTKRTYDELNRAYAYFNAKLFRNALPGCLITMQRKRGAYGYFAGQRFTTRDGDETTDEIALNPAHFKSRSVEEILSTLAHEMVHLWQFRHGKPSKNGYHNKEWAQKMKSIGLMPTSTGAPGGKVTGSKMTHYIIKDGAFDTCCKELIAQGVTLPYVEVHSEERLRLKAKKGASKTKYSCPQCGTNAWAKPKTRLICGDCVILLVAETQDEDD